MTMTAVETDTAEAVEPGRDDTAPGRTDRGSAKATASQEPRKTKDGDAGPSRASAVWRFFVPKSPAGRLSMTVWRVFFRGVVLVADYLIAMLSAVVVIPMLGAWLHEQSGASQNGLTESGTIAIWLLPLAFLVALLAAGEIALMRGMWRWATRRIDAIRDRRAIPVAAARPATTSRTTTNQRSTSSKNRKRSR